MSDLRIVPGLLRKRRLSRLLSVVLLATAEAARTSETGWTRSPPVAGIGSVSGPETNERVPAFPGWIAITGPITPVPEVPVTETNLAKRPAAGTGGSLPDKEAQTSLPAVEAGSNVPSQKTGLSLPVTETKINLPVVEPGLSLPVKGAGVIPPVPGSGDPQGEEEEGAAQERPTSTKQEDSKSDDRLRKLQTEDEESNVLDRTSEPTDPSPRRPKESPEEEEGAVQERPTSTKQEDSKSDDRLRKLQTEDEESNVLDRTSEATDPTSTLNAGVKTPGELRPPKNAPFPRNPREAQRDPSRRRTVRGSGAGDLPDRDLVKNVAELRSQQSDEHRLFNDLFETYNKRIRPAKSHVETTEVFFEVSLFNLIGLVSLMKGFTPCTHTHTLQRIPKDYKGGACRQETWHIREEKMQVNTEVILRWVDYHLQWDPSNYNDTTVIRVPFDEIWYPDIVLYNTAGSEADSGTTNTNAIIRFDGEVELVSHSLFTSSCEIDIQWYPFDQQVCDLDFASWSYDVSMLKLVVGPADLSKYQEHPEYFLEDFFSRSAEVIYPCCKLPFSTVTYSVQLQRRTIFSVFFFIMPGVLINICALMVFSLPAECGEKMALGTNSMLAMIVFLMAMIGNLPPSERLPVAGVYYGVCLSVLTLNIVFSIFVLNVGLSGDRGYRVPSWVRRCVHLLDRCLWLHVGQGGPDALWTSSTQKKVHPESDSDLERPVTEVKVIRVGAVRSSIPKTPTLPPPPLPPPGDDDDLKSSFQYRTLEALNAIRDLLAETRTRATVQEDRRTLKEEWRHIGRVLDRFLFIVFIVVSVLCNAVILSSSPYGTEYLYCVMGRGNCHEEEEEEEEPNNWPSALP
ncbi:neuronal acetylcholine receptor subunit alpha-7-like [Oratosquilla oratoria]|uniref:neuronal acetylcholine receptor subunit alpha-7-like n=1 Tax=Oratosquilla oratoria TaxID=337810 RepID=UPI003F77775D